MQQVSQKDAVFNAIKSLLNDKGISLSDTEPVKLSLEERKIVVSILIESVIDGSMVMSAEAVSKFHTPEKLRNYVTSLLSNWLRKDARLNGGLKQNKTLLKKNGNTAIIKKLKKLKSKLTNPLEIVKVQKEIDLKLQENLVHINMDLIPKHLKYLLDK